MGVVSDDRGIAPVAPCKDLVLICISDLLIFKLTGSSIFNIFLRFYY